MSAYVLPSQLYTKGSDASDMNDEEPPAEVQHRQRAGTEERKERGSGGGTVIAVNMCFLEKNNRSLSTLMTRKKRKPKLPRKQSERRRTHNVSKSNKHSNNDRINNSINAHTTMLPVLMQTRAATMVDMNRYKDQQSCSLLKTPATATHLSTAFSLLLLLLLSGPHMHGHNNTTTNNTSHSNLSTSHRTFHCKRQHPHPCTLHRNS